MVTTYASRKTFARFVKDGSPELVTVNGSQRWTSSDFNCGEKVIDSFAFSSMRGHPEFDRVWRLVELADGSRAVSCRLSRSEETQYTIFQAASEAREAFEFDRRAYAANLKWSAAIA